MKERYSRNIPAISEIDMNKLMNSHVLVVGCGGLGGYIIEYLARLGIGSITAVDGDVFSESNLNRQILSTCKNIGLSKADAAKERVVAINPDMEIIAVPEFFTENNADKLLKDIDIVIDALDNIESRFLLEDAAERVGVPIVHGAIDGWNIQAMLIKPGSRLLHQMYTDKNTSSKTALSFTPAICAGIQVSTAVSYLCDGESPLDGGLFISSIKDLESNIINLK